MGEYELVVYSGVATLAGGLAPQEEPETGSWSAEAAEKKFFKRLNRGDAAQLAEQTKPSLPNESKPGQRFRYRPSEIRWRGVWVPFAAAVILALALGLTVYRNGMKLGSGIAQAPTQPAKESVRSVEEQSSDAAHEKALLVSKLNEDVKTIEELKRQLAEQAKAVSDLKAASLPSLQATASALAVTDGKREEQIAAAQAKLSGLQKAVDDETARHQEATARATALEAKVSELTRLVRDQEQALDRKQAEASRQQELLDHDRDIRELMGARDLYIAEVHDVAGTGKMNKAYGRVFYTKGKSLIFYAYDLDAQAGLRNANTFQAWGRRGQGTGQALNLGIFYEDNASKKRWVLKAEDPKTLADIDEVFVTVEPNGGSHRPSGKQLLFAYLQVNSNHP
ncbi:MAG TPA: hypothetical protein VK525_01055 [Candidatus Saccharimonadales bacterium]|nr:hypothetical protein [Candidatus Saccharimonadales bacterium]